VDEADVRAAFADLEFEPPHPHDGGFKRVFFVRTPERDATVLKIYKKPVARTGDPGDEKMTEDELERVARELKLLSEVRHPNVVALVGGPGTIAIGEAEFLWYMEPRMASMLRDHEADAPWEPSRVEGLLSSLLLAIRELHARGAYHRDIKPGNIGLTRDGDFVLLDFGTTFFKELNRVTQTNEVAPLTTAFAAPEQFDIRATPDQRIDLYQVGLTVFLMATGQHPFLPPGSSPDLGAYLKRMKAGPDLDLMRAHGHSEQIVRVVGRLLQYELNLRFRAADPALRAMEGA
jgi:serine/threonine protein kinase